MVREPCPSVPGGPPQVHLDQMMLEEQTGKASWRRSSGEAMCPAGAGRGRNKPEGRCRGGRSRRKSPPVRGCTTAQGGRPAPAPRGAPCQEEAQDAVSTPRGRPHTGAQSCRCLQDKLGWRWRRGRQALSLGWTDTEEEGRPGPRQSGPERAGVGSGGVRAVARYKRCGGPDTPPTAGGAHLLCL